MLRTLLGFVGALSLVMAGASQAADSSASSEHKNMDKFQAKVSKVDAQNDKLTVEISSREGKPTEKTLDLEKNVDIRGMNGQAAKLADIKAGDVVCIKQDHGKVSMIAEENTATITNVDAKNGTVTVRMPDQNGKEADRVFHLTEDAEYINSDGTVATLDVFRSGDRVLFVEEQGKIKGLSKSSEQANVAQRPGETNEKK